MFSDPSVADVFVIAARFLSRLCARVHEKFSPDREGRNERSREIRKPSLRERKRMREKRKGKKEERTVRRTALILEI